jgi:hypothetical protein
MSRKTGRASPVRPVRRQGGVRAPRRGAYCRDCWDKKIAVEEIVAREFALKRYIRAHSAEKYLIYHSTLKRPCGQLIVVDDGYDLFLTMVLYPSFAWDEPAYHLEGDPEGRTFAEILVDVVAAEVIEPWGGGKWHLEIFRSSSPRPRTGTARCNRPAASGFPEHMSGHQAGVGGGHESPRPFVRPRGPRRPCARLERLPPHPQDTQPATAPPRPQPFPRPPPGARRRGPCRRRAAAPAAERAKYYRPVKGKRRSNSSGARRSASARTW